MIFENRKTIPLWPGVPPLSRGNTENDIPTITPYFPPVWKACGKAIVIYPGGAYAHLAEHEGKGYAEYFAEQGYHCFVVKYRLGSNHYHHPAELSDAARAVRFVRSLAPELGIRPECVGVMGSSAGGHLAASAGNLFRKGLSGEGEGEVAAVSSRPSWTVLCYPVITADPRFSSKGSFDYLLGPDFKPEDAAMLSLENSVTPETSPSFLWHTMEDTAVPVENSLLFANALRKNGVRFELHIYERGGHGAGLFQGHPWAEECVRWLDTF
ncbi:MAG: Acetylxylan esterase precursor [Lentisphaerae bacterium ADurb.Bin242]|nr:MAG: Acetylxylan esterase precursor [Lentisphaerae bacterium ADurb.Bin242]